NPGKLPRREHRRARGAVRSAMQAYCGGGWGELRLDADRGPRERLLVSERGSVCLEGNGVVSRMDKMFDSEQTQRCRERQLMLLGAALASKELRTRIREGYFADS